MNGFMPIPEMEGQFPCACHRDVVDLIAECQLVLFLSTHSFAYFLKDNLLGDFLSGTMAIFLLAGSARSDLKFFSLLGTFRSIQTLAVYVTVIAESAFVLSRQEAGVECLVGKRLQFLSTGDLGLYPVKGCFVDDGFMGIRYIARREFAAILLPLLVDRVGNEFLE